MKNILIGQLMQPPLLAKKGAVIKVTNALLKRKSQNRKKQKEAQKEKPVGLPTGDSLPRSEKKMRWNTLGEASKRKVRGDEASWFYLVLLGCKTAFAMLFLDLLKKPPKNKK